VELAVTLLAQPAGLDIRRHVALGLRDGKALTTRWSRPSQDGGTIFTTTASGRRMTVSRGQVWIVLAYQ
jgi:hypothetical protein